ncbi:MAG TPA: hypothetical protein VMS01_07850 [Stellaceae bacterium]|nr:hypothetical protein [Stellaceae bacterium]
MRTMVCYALAAAAICAPLASCVQSPPPAQALPAGPTPDEVADYARAQAQYRYAHAVGNSDAVMRALYTFSQIAREILSREDPRVLDAQVACESYRMAAPYSGNGVQTSFEPPFRYACADIEFRYVDATVAIRRDLAARAAAADLATIARAGVRAR